MSGCQSELGLEDTILFNIIVYVQNPEFLFELRKAKHYFYQAERRKSRVEVYRNILAAHYYVEFK